MKNLTISNSFYGKKITTHPKDARKNTRKFCKVFLGHLSSYQLTKKQKKQEIINIQYVNANFIVPNIEENSAIPSSNCEQAYKLLQILAKEMLAESSNYHVLIQRGLFQGVGFTVEKMGDNLRLRVNTKKKAQQKMLKDYSQSFGNFLKARGIKFQGFEFC